MQSSSLNLLLKVYANDVYQVIRLKNCSRDERREYETRVHLQHTFPKFMQLQGLTQLRFYMLLGKLKLLKNVSIF